MQVLGGGWPRALRHSGKVCLGEAIGAERRKASGLVRASAGWGDGKCLLGFHSQHHSEENPRLEEPKMLKVPMS